MLALGRAPQLKETQVARRNLRLNGKRQLTQTAARPPLAEQSAEGTLRRFVFAHVGHARILLHRPARTATSLVVVLRSWPRYGRGASRNSNQTPGGRAL
jgi:hypothetical protein